MVFIYKINVIFQIQTQKYLLHFSKLYDINIMTKIFLRIRIYFNFFYFIIIYFKFIGMILQKES